MVDGSFRFSDDRAAGSQSHSHHPSPSKQPPLTPILRRHATHTPSPRQSPSQDPLDHNVSRLRVSPVHPSLYPPIQNLTPIPSGNEIPRAPSPGGSTKLYHFAEWSSPECWSSTSQNNYILASPSSHSNTHNNTRGAATDAADDGGNGGETPDDDNQDDDDPARTPTQPLSRACSASSYVTGSSSAFVSEPRSAVYRSPVGEAPSRGGSFRCCRGSRGSRGSGGSRGLLLGPPLSGTAGGGSSSSSTGSGDGSGGVSGGEARGRRGRGVRLGDGIAFGAGTAENPAGEEGEGSSSPVEEENQTGVLQEVGNVAAGREGEGSGWEMEKEGGGCGCGGEEGMALREGVRPRVVSYPAAAV